MRNNNSWGIDYNTLKKIRDAGCVEIRILEMEDSIIYSVSMETLWSHATVMNWGDGQQAFLHRENFERTKYIYKVI